MLGLPRAGFNPAVIAGTVSARFMGTDIGIDSSENDRQSTAGNRSTTPDRGLKIIIEIL